MRVALARRPTAAPPGRAPRRTRAPRRAARGSPNPTLTVDVEVREQGALLRHVPDPAARAPAPADPSPATTAVADRDRAGVGVEEARDQRAAAWSCRTPTGPSTAVMPSRTSRSSAVQDPGVAERLRQSGDAQAAHRPTALHRTALAGGTQAVAVRGAARAARSPAPRAAIRSRAYGAAAPYSTADARDQNSVASVEVPIGASSSVAVSSVLTASDDQRQAGAEARQHQRQGHPAGGLGSRAPERARDVLEHGRRELEGGPDADDGPRQEQDRSSRAPAAAGSGRAPGTSWIEMVTSASATTIPGSALAG